VTLLSAIVSIVVAVQMSSSVSAAGVKGRFAGAEMSGTEVRPGPGDPDGSGEVVIRLVPPRGEGSKWSACAHITYEGIQDPIRVRVHEGSKGKVGPVKMTVPVKEIDEGVAFSCNRGFSERLINKVRRHERRYYAEAENGEFPVGAIRGQLRQYTSGGEPKR
jgi:hypothetical protein